MNKQNRLILIDGSAYIFRAYYGLPPMNRSDGTPINAVFGFTNMLVKLIEDYRDDKMIVVFDAARENFRNTIFRDYKANRGDTPEDLIPQFDIIRECVDSFKIPQIEIEGYEADDIIATYCNLAKKQKIESIIVSSDKDLMQLVNDNITMLDPMKNKKIGINEVIEKFGLPPEKVIQIQALTGDKVDNIPGAPGIGPKTAFQLIEEFGNVHNLIKNANKIPQEKRRNVIIDHKSDILISLELVKLKDNIDLPLKIIDIHPYSSVVKTENLSNFLSKQGFKSIAERLKNNSFIKKNVSEQVIEVELNNKYNLINNTKDLNKLISLIKKTGYCAIDTETNSLNVEEAILVGISIAVEENSSYYIPINHKNLIDKKRIKEQINETDLIKSLKIICNDASILKIGHNFKYDIRILEKYNLQIKSLADTMLLSYAIDNGITKHNMDDLAYLHFQHTNIKFKELVGSGKKEITFDYVEINKALDYAAEDALITLKLFNLLNYRIKKEKNNFIYNEIDLPLINVLASVEKNGIKIDTNYLAKLSGDFEKESLLLEKKIFKLAGKVFNIGSPKQLGEILFIDLKIKGAKKTKSGTFSTDVSTLSNLSDEGHEIASLILEWRELTKLKSTYTDALQSQATKNNSRVHTSYGLANTLTGRLSSNDPNLQNIPIRTEKGKKIRDAFIADNKNKLVSFDYSQIELRLAAEISKDKNFMQAFLDGVDIHASTAKEIFNLKSSDITSDYRRKAKAINFGILYGISPYGLAKQLSITNTEAKNYIEKYFSRYPKIKEYMDDQINFAKTNYYVETIFGRKCNIKSINDKNFAVRGFAERQSINAPIQGTAADIIKIAMIEIHKNILSKKLNVKMLLQVHDELIFEINEKDVKESSIIIKQIMEKSHLQYKDFTVPLTVDFGVGNTWGESH
ncbi:MAG: DNA polymerase I [Pelagibacteraceae bacterium]|nr:DNA polymerase I [Pelagibacteraceae bacterium]|tara:strand:- start:212 stop:2953 length:2742 start_codon:yes stop_codon:yes gene_type:complete